MDKILLIIRREYLSRVRKVSFIIMSILGPILLGSLIIIPIWLAAQGSEEKLVHVLDDSGLLQNSLEDRNNIHFEFHDGSLNEVRLQYPNEIVLYIPNIDIDDPSGILMFSKNSQGIEFEQNLRNVIQRHIESIRLEKSGISQSTLDKVKNRIVIEPINSDTGEKETDSKAASAIGYFASFAIYMFIFIYGAQVMRGVAEEKTNRIVEVIISSVRPFQLMMGKIIGIALVVLTQVMIWVVFTSLIYMAIQGYYADELQQMAQASQEQVIAGPSAKYEQAKMFSNISNELGTISLPLVIFCFVFYFLGGYLMYAALFAMIGGAVDSMEDSQQFMLPITIPLIASIIVLVKVLQEPHGTLAFWMSMIPLTSPVIMMMRVPFDVPVIELVSSMLILIAGFIFTTWFAGRVYRVGILMHGSKVNYKTLWKWFFMKN